MLFTVLIVLAYSSHFINAQLINPCKPGETNEKYFAHPTTENQFIECDYSGNPHVQECPYPLQWRDELKRCDKAQAGIIEKIHGDFINKQPPQQVIGNGINIGVLIPDNETNVGRRISNGRSNARIKQNSGRIDISSQPIAIEPCNLVTISGSKIALLNGIYNKFTTSDISFQMYRRVGTRPSSIIGLTNVWCLTMSFMKYEFNGATLSDIESNCVNNECCVLVSQRNNGQLLTESSRVWKLNTPEDKVNVDERIRVVCSDSLTPKIGKKDKEIIQIDDNSQIQSQPQMQVETSVGSSSSTGMTNIQQGKKQDFSKQLLVDNCDMVTCSSGSECLTKVGCNGCNPICNPFKNRQLGGVISIKCEMVTCPNGYTCQQNGDQLICAA